MSRRFDVRIGYCNQCERGTEAQPVAVFPNGLSLCEKHQEQVQSQHRELYRNHPLLERDIEYRNGLRRGE